jgi:hypothetical protein
MKDFAGKGFNCLRNRQYFAEVTITTEAMAFDRRRSHSSLLSVNQIIIDPDGIHKTASD